MILLTKLILVMPATNASSERSFSMLRCMKTYLRSTMKQERLNRIMTLHIHKELTDGAISFLITLKRLSLLGEYFTSFVIS